MSVSSPLSSNSYPSTDTDSQTPTTPPHKKFKLPTAEEQVKDFLDWVTISLSTPKKDMAEKLVRSWTWQPRQGMNYADATAKMVKNAQKAQELAINKNPQDKTCFAPVAVDQTKAEDKPLTISMEMASKQGTHRLKKQNEDVPFVFEFDDYMLAGLCDGHGGKEVAEHIRSQFKEKFPSYLKKWNHPYEALEIFIDDLERGIHKDSQLAMQGATLLVSLINKKTHEMITASVGDSGATSYVLNEKEWKATRHTIDLDWSTPKEAIRAAYLLTAPGMVQTWVTSKKPDHLRFPTPDTGLTCSRSIGDACIKGLRTRTLKYQVIHGISAKPKLTVAHLQPGTKLLLSSDGYDRHVSQKETIDKLKEGAELSTLVDFAQNTKKSQDDITVILLDIK